MARYDGWGWQSGKLRQPVNGIKAQSQRGKIGQSWWASRWIEALEHFVDDSRLARGRSYARKGQVISLEVGPDGAKARVQGSAARPYQVKISFKRLNDAEWERVIDALAGEALFAARLLSGEMPEHIEEAFATAGLSLLPTASGDLETDCSCPDWANPCKHVAAVHYLLGERFDADPFLIFELRGRGQDQIALALRLRRAGHQGSVTDLGDDPDDLTAIAETGPLSVPLTIESLEAFWSPAGGSVDRSSNFEPPEVDALPVKQLGVPPFWPDPNDFLTRFDTAYRAIAKGARDRAFGSDRSSEAV